MVYEEGGSSTGTFWATSHDGITWTRNGALWPGTVYRATPGLYFYAGTIYVFYGQRVPAGSPNLRIIFSSGTSMHNLVQYGGGYVLVGSQFWDLGSVSMPRIVFQNSAHWMTYEGGTLNLECSPNPPKDPSLQQNVYGWGLARSTDLIHWTKYDYNPINQSNDTQSCGFDMPQPALIGGKLFVYHTNDATTDVIRETLVTPGTVCNASQSYPNWREKNQVCMPSCGVMGGTGCYKTKDCPNGTTKLGMSWDCASCCR